jgi:hypothetical protein
MLTGCLDILAYLKRHWIICNESITLLKKFGLFTQKFDIVIELNLNKL